MAYTPGPWTARPETDYCRASVTHTSRQDPIAEVFGRSRDERQANAALIAEAPALLALARAYVALWPVTPGRTEPKATPEVLALWRRSKALVDALEGL